MTLAAAATYGLCSALLLVTISTSVRAWLNDYGQAVDFQCPHGQFLSHVKSLHSDAEEDRVWDFQCRLIPLGINATSCNWTDFVNDWDEVVTFQCPGQGFVAGFERVHGNIYKDSRFKFQCCQVAGATLRDCYFTDWENLWDGELNYTVPNDKVLTGMDSYHEDAYEDRRFKFEVCDIVMR